MTKLERLLEEIVTANRILAHEGVVDSFGHVSARHPDNPQAFPAVAGARAGAHRGRRHHGVHARRRRRSMRGGRAPYLERFIHGGIYEARPDVHSVVHNHSRA